MLEVTFALERVTLWVPEVWVEAEVPSVGLAAVTVLDAVELLPEVVLREVVAVVVLEGVVAVLLLVEVPVDEPVFTCLLAVVPLEAAVPEVLLEVLVPEVVLVAVLLLVELELLVEPDLEVEPVLRLTWVDEVLAGEVVCLEGVVVALRLAEVLREAVVVADLLSEELDLLAVVVLARLVWALSSDGTAAREKARTLTKAIL